MRAPLHGVAKLGVEAVDPSVDVVLEELSEGRPELSGGGSVAEDEIEDFSGHPGVDPLDDGEIVLDPLEVGGLRNGVLGDMRAQVAATEVNIKKMALVIVIVGGEIESNWDEGGDVGERSSHGGRRR